MITKFTAWCVSGRIDPVIMAERESHWENKAMWGGGAAALVGLGFGVGLVVELGAIAAGAGFGSKKLKEKFGKKG